MRQDIYGPNAAEWRPAHTPPDVREKFQSDDANNIRKFMAIMTPPTPNTRCSTPPLDASAGFSSARLSPTSPLTPSLPHLPPSSAPQRSLEKHKRREKDPGRDSERLFQPCIPRAPLCRSSHDFGHDEPQQSDSHTHSSTPDLQPLRTAKRKFQQGSEPGRVTDLHKRRKPLHAVFEPLYPVPTPSYNLDERRHMDPPSTSQLQRPRNIRFHTTAAPPCPISTGYKSTKRSVAKTKHRAESITIGKYKLRWTVERSRKGHG